MFAFHVVIGLSVYGVTVGACSEKRPKHACLSGYLVNGTDSLEKRSPTLPAESRQVADGTATLSRDSFTNALSMTVSPRRFANAASSILPASRMLQFTFEMPWELPEDAAKERLRLFMPIAVSEHISIEDTALTPSRRALVVTMSANDLGADLILASLFSPSGIHGVAYDSGQHLAIPLEARAVQPWFYWGTVWTHSGEPKNKTVIIQSEVEYPVIVDRITFAAAGAAHTVIVGKTLQPWSHLRVDLRTPVAGIDWGTVKVAKRIERSAPARFEQLINPRTMVKGN